MEAYKYLWLGDGQTWSMHLNLDEIAKDAGTVVTEVVDGKRVRYTVLPLSQARRQINFILTWATLEQCETVDEAFKKNPKLYKIWREKYERRYP